MKILVLATDYPDPFGSFNLMYIHVRNLFYVKHGINVTVLNFAASENYELDGIPVMTLDSYTKTAEPYDILVSHASNLRNHYRFLKKFETKFKRLVFIFHGHEVLKINEVYPKPYDFMGSQSGMKRFLQNRYDGMKLRLWKKYYTKLRHKSDFVFVSNWLYQQFLKNTNINFKENIWIIHNSIGEIFEQKNYNPASEKVYDFITIRADMDGSKYGVDIVNRLAKQHPDLKFLLIGKGNYFKHNQKADNIEWINRPLPHSEMLGFLDQSKCGLLPTREDTQGVMTCEMAVYGIPVITSDIDVCHEIFGDLENVVLIDNDKEVDLIPLLNRLCEQVPYQKITKFNREHTMQAEVDLLLGSDHRK